MKQLITSFITLFPLVMFGSSISVEDGYSLRIDYNAPSKADLEAISGTNKEGFLDPQEKEATRKYLQFLKAKKLDSGYNTIDLNTEMTKEELAANIHKLYLEVQQQEKIINDTKDKLKQEIVDFSAKFAGDIARGTDIAHNDLKEFDLKTRLKIENRDWQKIKNRIKSIIQAKQRTQISKKREQVKAQKQKEARERIKAQKQKEAAKQKQGQR